MTRKYKTILIYCVLILLAAAIIASGRYINSKKAQSPEQDYARKLAQLRADLLKAAQEGPKQDNPANSKRKSTRKTSKSGRT